ncbi:LysR family transcriptional regulator [Tabrizicola sp.]|uniref:LysR family transcriptional regulator n=1 Tax=Tabrizicola sp. TaxID=2005166 RepID=UPI001A60FA75|nr:LysR family transcriptional regulator [Tabrizicola sp.]MBL9061212.1 LysR family transcriptional regulator [Tabrizicola sp.]
MNQHIPFDWTQARAFLATVEAGSLSKAARALGLTQPTLSRQVAGLEADLGVVLFERVGRALVLTDTGRDLLDHFRDMGAAAGRISLAAGQSQALEGRVTISASDAFAVYVLVPLLAELQEVAPGIEVEVLASNTISDLQRREADIAIRHLRPDEPELIGRQVGDWRARLYASGRYLDRRGRPAVPEDLAGHDLLGFAPVERLVATLNAFGLPVTRRNFRHVTDNGLVLAGMAERGLGIAVTPTVFADRMVGLEPVLPDWPGIPVPLWLIAHREVQTSKRIRMVFDFLAGVLTRA